MYDVDIKIIKEIKILRRNAINNNILIYIT